MHTSSIRVARDEDLAQIASFWVAMFEEAGKHREAEFRSDWKERFVEYFAPRIESGDSRYFVAEEECRLIGSAGALLTEGYPAEIHGLRNGYIFGVYVLPAYRSRGIARALTQAAVEFLEDKHPWAIRLHASAAGRPIYERMGFKPTNEMQRN
jgi:GNAT superfamily N-acetyltransferase